MTDAAPLIRIRGLAKSYHRGTQDIPVLLGIDLDVAAGRRCRCCSTSRWTYLPAITSP